jgi:tRNA threonylcarbamoyladenosine biosynthesis protein TsaE
VSKAVFCVETGSPVETQSTGRILGRFLVKGDVVALVGELGAGKTILAKGIATALGVDDADSVTSPTYKVLNQYEGRVLLNHIDAYRLGGAGDFVDIGGEDLLSEDAVSVIEWADRIGNALPRSAILVKIHVLPGTGRRLEFFFDKNKTELAKALAAIPGGAAGA